MPRRAGKAASRRARQRSSQRARPSAPAPRPQPAALPPVGTPDAREAEALNPPRRTTPSAAALAGSQLTSRERAEYHYVERDLRNIGLLTAGMVVLLFVAWAVVQALGLTA
jgi:hypothetical protein